MSFIGEEKGYISASKKRGGETCFFYPQDLACDLKKGDYVRFNVDVNAKRREHYHLKAFNVEAMGRSNNTQQAKPLSRPSGVSNGGSTYARSVSEVKNNKEDLQEARMKRMEDLQEARMKRVEDMMAAMSLTLSQRSAVAGSSGSQ